MCIVCNNLPIGNSNQTHTHAYYGGIEYVTRVAFRGQVSYNRTAGVQVAGIILLFAFDLMCLVESGNKHNLFITMWIHSESHKQTITIQVSYNLIRG